MIATAATGSMDSATPSAGSPSIQDVLLVLCDKPLTDRLAQYLGDNYHLQSVKSEHQLLTMLEEQALPLIIINAATGYRQEGIAICSRLKAAPGSAQAVVILLIPANDLQARIACLESGADAWIERPLSPDYLRAQINALLTNRRRLKAWFTRSSGFHPLPISGAANNRSFLNRLYSVILGHLQDTGLNVDVMARLMNVSRPTLYRKIRSFSDRTPNEWIHTIRLDKAAELLSAGDHKVLEIAQMVGFHSRSNFGKAFLKHFGMTPMEYRHTRSFTQK